MSYSAGIPNATDPRALSQKQMLANFQTINTVWAVNHTNLTGTSPTGQHDVLTIRRQTTDPTTTATQVSLYNKLVSSIPELFFRPKNNGTPIQLTYPTINAGSGDTQQTFIAGPFIVYAGILTGGVTNGQVVTLTPSSTLIYANVTGIDVSASIERNIGIVATTLNTPLSSFTVNFFVSPVAPVENIYYFAIGKP
jgi:hypothetical protein